MLKVKTRTIKLEVGAYEVQLNEKIQELINDVSTESGFTGVQQFSVTPLLPSDKHIYLLTVFYNVA